MVFRTCFVAVVFLAVLPAGAAKHFPYESHQHTLPNGLKVIMIPMQSEGLVAYWTIVRTGARDEYEPGHTGFAHFFEHMMFRGTDKYPADRYNAMMTKMGAATNAFTSDDLTGYHAVIAKEDLELLMDMESDRFKRLKYPDAAFKTEAGAVYGEYRKNRTSPMFTIYERMRKEAFTTHTYGHTAMGYEEDIKAMPEMFDYSLSFFDRYYRPDNSVLLIVGDIQPEPTLELVKKHYGDWDPGYVVPKVPLEPKQTAERRFDVSYEGRSLPILWVAYKWNSFDPEDKTFAASVLLADLAFGETSDIYKKLVVDEQAVQFISGDADPNRDPGLFGVLTMIKDPAKIDYVLAEIDKTIAHYREHPPAPERLTDLKSRLKYGFLMSLDTPGNVAQNLSRYIALTGGIEAIDTLFATYDALTPEDLRAAANMFYVQEQRTIGVLRGVEQ